MKHEFKVTKSKEQTVYTLESATGGSTSAGSIASMDSTLGGMQRRNPPGDNILAQEKKETPKPRNFVAKNAKMGGAGQHKDKKKAEKQGDVKHKNKDMDMAEGSNDTIFPNAEVIKLRNGRPIGEIYQDENGWGFFHYGMDSGNDFIDSREDAIEGLRDLHQETGRSRRDTMEQGVAEGEKTMSRAAKGNEKYGKDGMKALAKAGRDGASEKKLDAIRDKHDNYNEDSDPCWDSHKMVGTKKKGGKQVPNCVPKEGVAEDHEIQMASSELQSIAKNAVNLLSLVRKYSEQEGLDAWQQSKITKAADYLNSVLQSINGEQSNMESDAYMESLQNMLERSVSQAQHNLMVGVAHNPAFAQKVKVKQKVGQEFARADQGHDISKLPIRVPKKK